MHFILVFLLFTSLSSNAKLLPETTMNDLKEFSQKTLDEKKDFEEVKRVIVILVKLDDEDPSRTSAQLLSASYNRHKALYDRALKSIETKKNLKQLKEIKMILANFSKKGNG